MILSSCACCSCLACPDLPVALAVVDWHWSFVASASRYPERFDGTAAPKRRCSLPLPTNLSNKVRRTRTICCASAAVAIIFQDGLMVLPRRSVIAHFRFQRTLQIGFDVLANFVALLLR
jgi:hypothetical protein